MTFEQQLEALAALVDGRAVKKNKHVKGPFTSGDFVTWQISRIFTPAGWSFTILDGPEMITLNDQSAYVRVVGRLEVTFANGQTAHQDDIGIWPLKATRGGGLADTAAERYETVEKAARTDCLKNAARNLGACFAPLSDLGLQEIIRRETYHSSPQAQAEARKPTERHKEDLFGEDVVTPPVAGGASPVTTDPAEARTRFYELSGPAIKDGRITAAEVNDLAKAANGDGWPAALAQLKTRIGESPR